MREVHQTSSRVQTETLLSMLSTRSGFAVGGLFPRLKADTLLEAEFRHTTFGPLLRVPRVLADGMKVLSVKSLRHFEFQRSGEAPYSRYGVISSARRILPFSS